MRLDQWLWAVRLFKTRSIAVDAIKGGHVRVDGVSSKPAHTIKKGQLVAAQIGIMIRTVRVVDAPKSRVGAKLVAQYMEDLTPPEEFEKQRLYASLAAPGYRARGTGRPTKRDRRELDSAAEEMQPRPETIE